jgi:anionic cell wall polymer biosynthesis LytR-Cps2A-Psr (LCP) family protein
MYKFYIRNFSGSIKMKLKILIPIIFIIILLSFVLACTSIIRGFVVPYKYAPIWSPDGKKIAFKSNRDNNGEIYIMNIDSSGQKKLTETE